MRGVVATTSNGHVIGTFTIVPSSAMTLNLTGNHIKTGLRYRWKRGGDAHMVNGSPFALRMLVKYKVPPSTHHI